MISFKEAQEIIIDLAAPFGTETVSLEKALGRVLAEPVTADRDYPPFNRASMDGYAMKYTDIEKGIFELEMIETIFAGQLPQTALKSGQCYKIMTGAAVPVSADMIIQRENITGNDNHITIRPGKYKPFQQISKQGEDVKGGERIAMPPLTCTPALVSALAALGKATVAVRKLPEVAIFTTGNEVVPVGGHVSPLQIRNSNQYMLRALVQQWGIAPFLCDHIRDDKKDLYESLSKALSGDIIIISGGVSAGDADFVPEILESLGVKKLFHKVAIKPGKPIWFGHTPGGAVVFALPGNPLSGLVAFILFVELYLSHCLGSMTQIVALPLTAGRIKKSNLDEFFPVTVCYAPLGIAPVSFNGSGDILAAITADGIAHHTASIDVISPQTLIGVRLFKK